MSRLTDNLEEELQKHNLDLQDWKNLLLRLLDYGVICRSDSQVEADFYDQFVRVETLLDEFLGLLGIRFQHDKHFHYVRLIPPGARMSGLEDEADEPFNGGLRTRLNQHEIALVLVLRAEYDKSLREGLIDEQGCVTLSIEAVVLAMKNLLGRTLPENQGERRQLFRRLRQLRLIHYVQESDLDQGDSWFRIRPLVVNLVNNDFIEGLRSGLDERGFLLESSEDEPVLPDDRSMFS